MAISAMTMAVTMRRLRFACSGVRSVASALRDRKGTREAREAFSFVALADFLLGAGLVALVELGVREPLGRVLALRDLPDC